MQQGIKKLQWFEYLKVVFLKILILCRVFANQVTYSPGSYHIVRKNLKRVAPVCITKHMFVLLLQRISSHTDGIVIKASYITVHSYDILVINTYPRLCLRLV